MNAATAASTTVASSTTPSTRARALSLCGRSVGIVGSGARADGGGGKLGADVARGGSGVRHPHRGRCDRELRARQRLQRLGELHRRRVSIFGQLLQRAREHRPQLGREVSPSTRPSIGIGSFT